MNKIRYYISSFRLRTLPLSMSGIILGSVLAASDGCFDFAIFVLTVLTALFLQILANIANEYGDYVSGVDTPEHQRMSYPLVSGTLSASDFKVMIAVFVSLSCLSGLALVWAAFDAIYSRNGLIMIILGAAAVIAALRYTLGRHPYGYIGLGDLFVLLFFGLLSCMGSYFLMCGTVDAALLLPAFACGFLSVGVLNINNIRDMETDRAARRTLPLIMGEKAAKIYHIALIAAAFVFLVSYCILRPKGWHCYLFLLWSPFFALHIRRFMPLSGRDLDARLPELSILTLLLCTTFGVLQLF